MLSVAVVIGTIRVNPQHAKKTASENVVCLCRLLHLLENFKNIFLHTGKPYGL